MKNQQLSNQLLQSIRNYARIEIDDEEFINIVGEVYAVNVEDHYFYDKGEPIYITVSINPQKELDTNIDSETLAAIPLDCITKY